MKGCKILGGNSRAINRSTKEIIAFAEPLDLTLFNRNLITQELIKLFDVLNTSYKERYNDFIWSKFDIIESGYAFNGSSEHLFNKNITDEEFLKSKSKIGDIDITVDRSKNKNLFDLLCDLEGKQLTHSIKYIGQNKLFCFGQINAVFEFRIEERHTFIQVDFEFVDYVNDKPSEFSKFSHSASWEDIKLGFKGFHHKFLLINLVRAISENDSIIVLTKKSKEEPIGYKISKKDEIPRMMAFSIDRGLRKKYRQIKFNDEPLLIENKYVYKELETNESDYEQKVENIFFSIFQDVSYNYDKRFESFVGLFDLIVENFDLKIYRKLYRYLVENLWGNNAQGLVRNDPESDYRIKLKLINHFKSKLPFIDDEFNDYALIENYYKNYKTIEI